VIDRRQCFETTTTVRACVRVAGCLGGRWRQVPREVRLIAAIPKNAMGKVNKKQLRLLFGP
jgi:non-ribosomal peptide synthetase component E (peptide arylation enzyme)